MIWLCVLLVVIGIITLVVYTNSTDKSQPLNNNKAIDKSNVSPEDDLGELEMYIDEVDDNGEPW